MQVQTISEQLFFTTARIDTVTNNGAAGSGTGFFFTHRVGALECPFIVTNKHVVTNMREGSLTFLLRKGDLPTLGNGHRVTIQDWPKAWFGHPAPDVDIAICPLAGIVTQLKQQHGLDVFFRSVDRSIIPSEQQMAELDAVEEITFVGYPNGVWDSKNLLPVVRRGTTATPMEVDFENTPRFIIDASVFGGSSGSPVFVFNQGTYTVKNMGTHVGSRLYFVGVIAAVFFRTQLNQIVAVPIPTQVQPMSQHQEMIDLGIVFKARTVVETVEAFLQARGVHLSAGQATSAVPPASPPLTA